MIGSVLGVQGPWTLVTWSLLGLAGVVGMVALVSPRTFSKLATGGSRWIDTQRVIAKLDEPINVDHYILPYSRVLGAAVIISCVILGLAVLSL
jgi:hypothetical protein